jgi:hypothetical protein
MFVATVRPISWVGSGEPSVAQRLAFPEPVPDVRGRQAITPPHAGRALPGRGASFPRAVA